MPKTAVELKVESVTRDGSDLLVEVSCADRDSLTEGGRPFVIEYVSKSPEYATWANAGVDKASGPQPFDPANPQSDPYDPKNSGTKWHYRQLFKLTKMI